MSVGDELLDDMHMVDKVLTEEFAFPLSFKFKIGTLANDFVAKDANGVTIAYVRQKMFKLKEAIMVYAKEDKKDLLYTIKADRILDWRANYAFTDQNGDNLGRVGRKGVRSIWKASYEIYDNHNELEYKIGELNPWAKVGDAFLGEVPVLGALTGYMFNPKYGLTSPEGELVAKMSKEPSFWGRKFKFEKLGDLEQGDSQRMILALMMMLLLERRRG